MGGSGGRGRPVERRRTAEPIDFNGDSLDDLAIGAPGEDVGVRAAAGVVNVQYGSPAGLAGRGQVLTQGTPEAGDGFGAALAKGRFNDDDFVDLAVGAPAEDLGRTDAAGVVTVFYGSATGLTGPGDILQQTSPENGDAFGSTLDSGDFDADGVDDLAVGAPGEDVGRAVDAGAVTIFRGSAGGLAAAPAQNLFQVSPENGDRFGSALEAGPFDTGAAFDLAVGAPGETVARAGAAGAVTVFYAAAGGGLAGPGQTLLQGNPEGGDLFGSALVSGSFRHNGRFDLAVGAPGESISLNIGMGAIAVFLDQPDGITPGSPRTVTQREAGGAEETGDQFGSALAAGLYNGDDFYDLAIGVPGEDIGTVADAGAVSTLHGSAGGLTGGLGPLFQGDNGLGDLPERGDRFGQTLAKGIFSNNFNDDPSTTWPSVSPLTMSATARTPAWSASSRARRLAFRARARSTSRVPTSAGEPGSAVSPRPVTCWEPPSSDRVPHPSGKKVITSQDKASRPAQSPRRSLVAGPQQS